MNPRAKCPECGSTRILKTKADPNLRICKKCLYVWKISKNPSRSMRCPVCSQRVAVGSGITKLTCPTCGNFLAVRKRR